MNEIPPKQTVSGTPASAFGLSSEPQFAPVPEAGEPGALVSIHAAALHANADSFPVLKAFQDYLEAERQRARRRVTLLSGFFIALMVVVVAGFLTGGILLFSYMSKQQAALMSVAFPHAVAAAVTPAATPAAAPAPTVRDPELEKLQQSLAAMQAEYARIQESVTALRAPAEVAPPPVPAVTDPAVRSVPPSAPPAAGLAPVVAHEPVSVAASPVAEPVTTARRPVLVEPSTVAAAPPPPVGHTEETIFIRAAGSRDPIPWRVFMPLVER